MEINHKQGTRWQHISQLKASSFYSLLNKLWLLKNATFYAYDWHCHLAGVRAWLKKLNNIEIEVLFETVNFLSKTYMKFLKGSEHFSFTK
jgi:hypothetical protein